jgi:hypothetical protein
MMIFSFFAGGILQLAMWSNANSYGVIIAFSALVYGLGGYFFMLMPAVAAQVRFHLFLFLSPLQVASVSPPARWLALTM